ncbi:O-antigen ligase family protein [Sphingorhabdus sp. 109]|jgi:O-antigen ligase|uniref:O-antigen ligase family protein n=1 Tax=Sphingorhabdus sp. 109 TaxID=2653173 RepID=UPI0012F2329D|nr:O-antigen ligase family protein [Sphingorhabdus sp. 109]VWX60781.1 O-antigen ligase [Sphingorhabdus sp. 109]
MMNNRKSRNIAPKGGIADRALLLVLGAFITAICLLGGSVRGDAVQLIVLRPAACLVAGYALYQLGASRAGGQKVQGLAPLYAGLAVLAVWMIIQLIPLPYQIWSELPGRALIAKLDAAGGQRGLSRPLSFSPSRTANSLAALIVPLAALLLFHRYPNRRKKDFLALIIVIALGNSLLGILQILGPSGGPLYFYEFTNATEAVGFFANRNHSSVFSAVALLIISYIYSQNWRFFRLDRKYTNMVLVTIYLLIFLSSILNGSRAGFLCGGIALFLGLVLYNLRPADAKGPGMKQSRKVASIIGSVAIVAFSLTLILLFFASDRVPAVTRLIEADNMSNLRTSAMPTLLEMIGTYWPFGTGFGTFDKAYFIHEPNELLMPSYFNQAHNDWLQMIIEGGAPVAVLAIAGILFYFAAVLKLFVLTASNRAHLFFWFGIMTILGVASLVDYPLRTPLFSAVAVWIVALLLAARRNPEALGFIRDP